MSYGVLQLGYLVVVNAAVIVWGLLVPFHYRKAKALGRTHYIHIAIIISALLLPLPLSLAHLKDGFIGLESPVTVCVGRNSDLSYYSFALPVSILFCTGTVLLVLVGREIFKVLIEWYIK